MKPSCGGRAGRKAVLRWWSGEKEKFGKAGSGNRSWREDGIREGTKEGKSKGRRRPGKEL